MMLGARGGLGVHGRCWLSSEAREGLGVHGGHWLYVTTARRRLKESVRIVIRLQDSAGRRSDGDVFGRVRVRANVDAVADRKVGVEA